MTAEQVTVKPTRDGLYLVSTSSSQAPYKVARWEHDHWRTVGDRIDDDNRIPEGRIETWMGPLVPAGRPTPPAEPLAEGGELPTHWGHWKRDGKHYWVFGNPLMWAQGLDPSTGLPEMDALVEFKNIPRGHWHPAPSPSEAERLRAARDALADDLKRIGEAVDAAGGSVLDGTPEFIARLAAERDAAREEVKGLRALLLRSQQLWPVEQPERGPLPEWVQKIKRDVTAALAAKGGA